MKIKQLIEQLQKAQDEYGEELEVSYLLQVGPCAGQSEEFNIDYADVVVGRANKYEVQLT